MNHPQVAYRNTKKMICYVAINSCPYPARNLMVGALENFHHLIGVMLVWLHLLAASQFADWIAATTF